MLASITPGKVFTFDDPSSHPFANIWQVLEHFFLWLHDNGYHLSLEFKYVASGQNIIIIPTINPYDNIVGDFQFKI